MVTRKGVAAYIRLPIGESCGSPRRAMEEYVAFRRVQGATDPEAARKMHAEAVSMQKSILDQDRKNLDRECALIQEYGLPRDNKMNK